MALQTLNRLGFFITVDKVVPLLFKEDKEYDMPRCVVCGCMTQKLVFLFIKEKSS